MYLSYHIREVFATALFNLSCFSLFLLPDLKNEVLKGYFTLSNCFKNFDTTVVLNDTVYIVPFPIAVNTLLAQHLLKYFRCLFFIQSIIVCVAFWRLNFSENLLIALFLFKQKLRLVVAYCKLDLRFILSLKNWTLWHLRFLKKCLLGLFFREVLRLILRLLVIHELSFSIFFGRLRFFFLEDLIYWRSV